jgi:hypothetical protein
MGPELLERPRSDRRDLLVAREARSEEKASARPTRGPDVGLLGKGHDSLAEVADRFVQLPALQLDPTPADGEEPLRARLAGADRRVVAGDGEASGLIEPAEVQQGVGPGDIEEPAGVDRERIRVARTSQRVVDDVDGLVGTADAGQ